MNRFLAFTLLAIVMSACNLKPCINKTYFLGTYESFIESVKDENNNYTSSDWDSKDDKMRGFVDDCYKAHKNAMTAEDKTLFWTKYVEYMLIRYKAEIITAIRDEDEKSEVNISEEISKSIKDLNIKKLIKDTYGDEIEQSIDEVLNHMEDWAEELKKWLRSN